MAAATLFTVFGVHLAAMASPGPNVLLITQAAARHSRRHAVFMALGVATGTLVLASAAVLGVGVIFETVPPLYRAVKIIGGLYLLWLGIQMWQHSRVPLAARPLHSIRSTGHCFRIGLLTNLTNTKAAIFFGAVLTALIPGGSPAWVSVAAVAIIVVNALWWHIMLAVVFSSAPVQRAYARAKTTVDRAAGTILAILGVRLLAR